jgi:hypothetical protein
MKFATIIIASCEGYQLYEILEDVREVNVARRGIIFV